MNISLYNLTKDTQQFSVVILGVTLNSQLHSERGLRRKEFPLHPYGELGFLVHVFYLSLVVLVDNLTTQF